jgi:hypothetical protein
MHIDMKNPKGIKLKTEGKYCAEDIDVVPTLEEVIVDPTDTEQIVEPSANYAGIKKVTVRASGGGGMTYSVVEITSSQTTLTDEQYNTLIASAFNKIKFNNIIYSLYQETTTGLLYTANYFNKGNRITIIKATKGITRGSLDSLTSISSYVKNSLDYAQSNTTYALSAYQGKVLNDRLTALEDAGGATAVELTLPESSTQGTITAAQLTTLQASNENYILINGNEIYRLNDKGHTEGIWTYTHDGYNVSGVTKYLNLTIATKAFTITEQTGGGGSVPVVALTGTSGTITQAQWDMLYNSEVSYISLDGNMYSKLYHSATSMTFDYFGTKSSKVNVHRLVTITKANMKWTSQEADLPTTAGCILSMQNNSASQGSTDPFYGHIFIGSGLKITNGILSLAVSSPATVYVHDIKLSTETCAESNLGSDTTDANVLEFAFYSSEGFFDNEPLALWSYIVVNNNWTPAINGTLYGNIGGGETVIAITKETVNSTDYLCIRTRGGYGEVTKYYVTETDMLNTTKTTLIDSCREI